MGSLGPNHGIKMFFTWLPWPKKGGEGRLLQGLEREGGGKLEQGPLRRILRAGDLDI